MKRLFAVTFYYLTVLNPADPAHAKAKRFFGRTDRIHLTTTWVFTDCISFVVMQERGLKDALTGDHHFEQAGFKTLLK